MLLNPLGRHVRVRSRGRQRRRLQRFVIVRGAPVGRLRHLESTDAESNSTFVVSTINNPDGGGNLPGLITFGSPAGVTMSVLVSSIELAGAPTTGTFTAATNGCGSVEVEYGTDVGDTDVFTAVSGSTCTDGGMQTARGSWSLNLTSATLSSGSSDPYTTVDLFAVHGTFTAMLADSKGSPGTLSLTF